MFLQRQGLVFRGEKDCVCFNAMEFVFSFELAQDGFSLLPAGGRWLFYSTPVSYRFVQVCSGLRHFLGLDGWIPELQTEIPGNDGIKNRTMRENNGNQNCPVLIGWLCDNIRWLPDAGLKQRAPIRF